VYTNMCVFVYVCVCVRVFVLRVSLLCMYVCMHVMYVCMDEISFKCLPTIENKIKSHSFHD
jgi:hypothetical protein